MALEVNVRGADGRTPLHWAAFHGHVEAMRTLVELGADVHAAAVQLTDGRYVDGWTRATRCIAKGQLR